MTIHETKHDRLKQILQQRPRLAIAFSGGVDSVLLLQQAVATLGRENVLAVTVAGPNFAARESAEAALFAAQLGAQTATPAWDPFIVREFALNSEDRCYHCKKALYTLIMREAARLGFNFLADGANASDADDYRPGSRAAKELGVLSPLADAGMTKDDIRALLRQEKIPFWNKPAFACLATRVPTGIPVDKTALARIESAEDALLALGFKNVRVRHHGDLARIEVDPDERRRFVDEDLWEPANDAMKNAGYRFAALDLHGYKKGNMNAQ